MIGAHPLWAFDELARRLDAERVEKCDQLGQGFCDDFADYRYDVGFLAGMERAKEIAEEIKREMEK